MNDAAHAWSALDPKTQRAVRAAYDELVRQTADAAMFENYLYDNSQVAFEGKIDLSCLVKVIAESLARG